MISSCSMNKFLKTFSVISYKEVADGYQYSDIIITFKSKLYKPIICAEYSMDTLYSIKLYKSEGSILYSKSELENDQLLKKNLHINDVSSLIIYKNYILDRGKKIEITEQSDSTLYCILKNELFIYKFQSNSVP